MEKKAIYNNRRTGFTLIELLVVIAIIALLLAIIIPSLRTSKELAKRVVCASNLRQVGVAMSSYADSNEHLPDAKDSAGNSDYGHGYTVYRDDMVSGGRLVPLRWAKLYEGGYMDTPEIFYCPSNRIEWMRYESYTSPTPWGTLPQDYNTTNQWVRIGFTYLPIPTGKPKWVTVGSRERLVLAEKFIQLNPNTPYATDVIHRRGVLSHQRSRDDDDEYRESNKYSVNALFSDTHVANCNDQDVFKNEVWDNISSNYDRSYLTVFKLIGPE